MKKNVIFLAALAGLLLLPACIPSIHPLYTPDTLIFEAALLGVWKEPGTQVNKETWIFQKQEKGMYYLTHIDGSGRVGGLEVGMVRLGKHLFLDFYPDNDEKKIKENLKKLGMESPEPCELNDMLGFHLRPMHTFARIELNQGTLNIHMLGSDWLHNMFKERKIRIDHEQTEGEAFVLTAFSEELQKFLTKYGEESRAYAEVIGLIR